MMVVGGDGEGGGGSCGSDGVFDGLWCCGNGDIMVRTMMSWVMVVVLW